MELEHVTGIDRRGVLKLSDVAIPQPLLFALRTGAKPGRSRRRLIRTARARAAAPALDLREAFYRPKAQDRSRAAALFMTTALAGGFKGSYTSGDTAAPPVAPFILSSPLELYVAPTGNDSNAGTAAAPLLTLAGCWAKVAAATQSTGLLASYVLIHIAAFPSNAPLVMTPVPPYVPLSDNAAVYLWGDGALQGVQDGFTAIYTGTVAAGSTTANLIPAGAAPVAEALNGRALVFDADAGHAQTRVRQVRNNTAGSIVPVYPYASAPTVGAGYRVCEPATNVVLNSRQITAGTIPVSLINLYLRNGTAVTALFAGNPLVRCYGVVTAGVRVGAVNGTNLLAGTTDTIFVDQDGKYTEQWAALGGVKDWTGWGMAGLTSNLFNGIVNRASGFFVSEQFVQLAPGSYGQAASEIFLLGGATKGAFFTSATVRTTTVFGQTIPFFFRQTNSGSFSLTTFDTLFFAASNVAFDTLTSGGWISTFGGNFTVRGLSSNIAAANGSAIQAFNMGNVLINLAGGFVCTISSTSTSQPVIQVDEAIVDLIPVVTAGGIQITGNTSSGAVFIRSGTLRVDGSAATFNITNPNGAGRAVLMNGGRLETYGCSQTWSAGGNCVELTAGSDITSNVNSTTSLSITGGTSGTGRGAQMSGGSRILAQHAVTMNGVANALLCEAGSEVVCANALTATATAGIAVQVDSLSSVECTGCAITGSTTGVRCISGGRFALLGSAACTITGTATDGIDCTGGGQFYVTTFSSLTVTAGANQVRVSSTQTSTLAAALPAAGATFSNTNAGSSLTRNA